MKKEEHDKAPVFGNWNTWYLLVTGFLVILIILFTLFTKRFA